MRMTRLVTIGMLLVVTYGTGLHAQNWKPIDPAHLSTTAAPVVDKDAPAEAIFWDVSIQDVVDDAGLRTIWTHYIRIKIFTTLGVEQQSKVDIPYLNSTEIKDIAGRTIKPNGQIVELRSDAVNERTLVQANKLKVRAKSFVLPGVEPGSIIEYRWTERRRDTLSFQVHMDVQRDLPIQTVRYRVKPADLGVVGIAMKWHAFNMPQPITTIDKEKFWNAVATNVPAFRYEPDMPPENNERQWLFLYYDDEKKNNVEEIWNSLAKSLFTDGKNLLKFNGDVKRTAETIAGDASAPEEKLKRLYDYCRTSIKRSTDDASGLNEEQLKKLKENKNAADVLKRKIGTGGDIRQLFGAMAASLGLEARYALVTNRDEIFFRQDFPHRSMVPDALIAVKISNDWRLYDPANTYVPADMLAWQHEGVAALIADSSKGIFVTTPISSPERSLIRRTADMKLSADGTLEGDVRVEYTGHSGADEKEQFDELAEAEQENTVKESLESRLGSNVEVTNIKFSDITDPIKPISYTYHIRVASYAQRTGRRLFLQPGYFQKGVGPRFTGESRVHPIYFRYPSVEEQVVTIELPEGFELDNADLPPPFVQKVFVTQDIEIAVSDDKRAIRYTRKSGFTVPALLFKPNQYSALKQMYDLYHSRDNHTLSLRQTSGRNQ